MNTEIFDRDHINEIFVQTIYICKIQTEEIKSAVSF